MMQGTYTAALGMMTQQKRLDTVANNIANVSTTGFKSSQMDFKDALYQTMQRVVQPQNNLNMQKGHGTLVSGITVSFKPGVFQETGISTNCFLDGEGFFAIETPRGEVRYTRDGSFTKSDEPTGTYLVSGQGNYVLDQNGRRIRIDGDNFVVSENGELSAGNGSAAYAKLQIVNFPNVQGLVAASENCFIATEASGAAEQVADGSVRVMQNGVEGSNVDMAAEFSKMIRSSRVFQFSSRALSVADGMDEAAISVRR